MSLRALLSQQPDGISVFDPDLFGDKGWVRHDEIKKVVILFRDVFRVIEVVLVVVRIVLSELGVILSEDKVTSNK